MTWFKKHLIPIGLVAALVLAALLLGWQAYDTNQRAEQQVSEAASQGEEDAQEEQANDAATETPKEEKDPKEDEPKSNSNSSNNAAPTTGVIEGSLTYPSGGGIPSGMTLCAKNTATNVKTCTSNHLNNKKYIYDLGYRLKVKPGNYVVYAVNPSDNQPAYYNSYMKKLGQTGQWGDYPANCNNLSPLSLAVVAGQTYFDIALGDWYYDAQCN